MKPVWAILRDVKTTYKRRVKDLEEEAPGLI
jgi:hypothetical protein